MGIKRCLIVIINYGMSFVPGIAQARICLNFPKFLKEKMKTWSKKIDTSIDSFLNNCPSPLILCFHYVCTAVIEQLCR